MGSGVSVHKNGDSAMKLRFKAKKILVPTPTKEKPLNGQDPVIQFGSKEETFFDSQAWLESDCEDDFLSVNGDFTPSRGSTSNQQSSPTGNPQLNKSQFMDRAPDLSIEMYQSSPTDKKKKLSELLQEGAAGDAGELESKPDNLVRPSNSTNGLSYLFPYLSRSNSVHSSDKTPNVYSKSEKEKSTKVTQCCLPSLVKSFSFSERKKRPSPSPEHSGEE